MRKILRVFGLMAAIGGFAPRAVFAQVPQLFNYQGIARDAGGNVLPNRVIGVELSVLDGGPAGTVVYQEASTDTTNAFGLFTMQVGGGVVVSGTFSGINWATGNKYLQTAIDLTGGTNYTLSGTTQLLSVPYALYAQNAVIGVSSGSWSLKGNAGTGDTAFIGTTDNTPLLFKTNDSASGSIRPNTNETYFGYLSGKKAVGDVLNETVGNTAFGAQTLTYTTSGAYNTAVGFEALLNCNGLDNTAFGAEAMQNTETGIYNTALGGSAGYTNVTGNYLTLVGTGADVSVDGLSNATALGANAVVTANNMVQIGSPGVTVIEGQVPFTTPSDGRFKFNVREDVKGLDFILKLRPVTYQFNTKKEQDFIKGVQTAYEQATYNEAMMIRRTGFIAQEVEKAAKASGYDFDGLKIPRTEKEYYSLSYASFVVPLVKAVQEQEGVIKAQGEVIERQEKRIDDLTNEVEELRQMALAATKK
jgi:hypothetical protein